MYNGPFEQLTGNVFPYQVLGVRARLQKTASTVPPALRIGFPLSDEHVASQIASGGHFVFSELPPLSILSSPLPLDRGFKRF